MALRVYRDNKDFIYRSSELLTQSEKQSLIDTMKTANEELKKLNQDSSPKEKKRTAITKSRN